MLAPTGTSRRGLTGREVAQGAILVAVQVADLMAVQVAVRVAANSDSDSG